MKFCVSIHLVFVPLRLGGTTEEKKTGLTSFTRATDQDSHLQIQFSHQNPEGASCQTAVRVGVLGHPPSAPCSVHRKDVCQSRGSCTFLFLMGTSELLFHQQILSHSLMPNHQFVSSDFFIRRFRGFLFYKAIKCVKGAFFVVFFPSCVFVF